MKQPAREVLLRADSAWRTSDRRAAAGRGFQFGAAELFTPNSCSGGKGARPNGRLRRAAPQLPQKPRQPAATGLCTTAQPRQQAGSSSPGTASRVYLRWRIFERIRRFFRPSFRRPLPDFFVPMRRSVLSATYTVLTGWIRKNRNSLAAPEKPGGRIHKPINGQRNLQPSLPEQLNHTGVPVEFPARAAVYS